jgi:hypothetical protein
LSLAPKIHLQRIFSRTAGGRYFIFAPKSFPHGRMPIRRKRNDVGYFRWPLAFPIERPYLRVIYDTHDTPFIFGVSLPDYIPYLKRFFPHLRTLASITAPRDAENYH